MAQYFLAAINSTPARVDEESIALQLAKIGRQCRILDRLEPLGAMNYSRENPYEDNHWDLIEIARLCIQFEKYGKLEEVKELLLSIKRELSEKNIRANTDFVRSEKVLKQASIGRDEAAVKLDKIFSDLD